MCCTTYPHWHLAWAPLDVQHGRVLIKLDAVRVVKQRDTKRPVEVANIARVPWLEHLARTQEMGLSAGV